MNALYFASFLSGFVFTASAATIDWNSQSYQNRLSPSKNFMGIDQFDQSGMQIFAVSTGFLSARLEQTSDILFASSDPNLDTTSMPNNYTDFHENSGGNNEISRSGLYSNNGPALVTIRGLEVGSTYRIQNLIYDGRGSHSSRTLEIDGIPMVSHANGTTGLTWGDGSLSTGTFVADAASQCFTIEVFNASGSSAGGQLNAIILHKTADALEPSAVFQKTGRKTDVSMDRLAGQFDEEKFKLLLRLNRCYLEKAKKLKARAMEEGNLPAAIAANRQVNRFGQRQIKLVEDRNNVVLISSLAGDWRLSSSGWAFKIFSDGTVTASEPISERGRIEVLDYEKRIVRMTGFAKPMTWVVAKGSKKLLGTQHPARRSHGKAMPGAPKNAKELAEFLDGTTWNISNGTEDSKVVYTITFNKNGTFKHSDGRIGKVEFQGARAFKLWNYDPATLKENLKQFRARGAATVYFGNFRSRRE
ncbi:MAG: hypothetical protein VCA55_14605 [Verrucomicrobiales bacterium]